MSDSGAILSREADTVQADAPASRLRPKDAASLILVDRSRGEPRILMGKRSSRHAFMPSAYVFPGGRRDAADARIAVSSELDDGVVRKLLVKMPGQASERRARALAVAAVRETLEETGLALGPLLPASQTVGAPVLSPDLSRLRYVARAVTPPGRTSRRYDTRFFTCFVDETDIALTALCDSDELHDLRWLTFSQTEHFALPRITGVILAELARELEDDPTLPFGRPVPYHYMRNGKFCRDIL